MREVWRLREMSYREVGITLSGDVGGNAMDMDGVSRQLVVWDDEARRIVGGYRYVVGVDVMGCERLSLSRYFSLSQRFVNDFLPRAMELSRSFVSPEYQNTAGRHTIYALDALWEGLGRIVEALNVRYLFGRVTLYPSMCSEARDLLLGFMRYIFPPRERLMVARLPIGVGLSRFRCRQIFVGETLAENYRILLSRMRDLQCAVPPIISSYMRLSPSMQTFDVYENSDLGGVVETAIMLTVEDFYDDIKRRYLSNAVSRSSRRVVV
ncbi:MAG: GNAT family N-acetyltransferase [Alistipes sp.]|nr:GNAT family N-acetyltransferase [Alistipes sp.]